MSKFETSPLTPTELVAMHASRNYDWGEALTLAGNAINGLKDSVPLGQVEKTIAHMRALKEATNTLQVFLTVRGVVG